MPTERADLITHPIRSRILTALMGRQLTTQQLGHLLPDVPLSSIYRHLRLLTEGGVVKAVDEVRVNGALTKVYAVERGQARITVEDARGASRAEHLSHFTRFLATLSELHGEYLEHEDAEPSTDPLHALMGALYLTPAEYGQLMEELSELLTRWSENGPAEERRRVVFAHLAIPGRPDPPLE